MLFTQIPEHLKAAAYQREPEWPNTCQKAAIVMFLKFKKFRLGTNNTNPRYTV